MTYFKIIDNGHAVDAGWMWLRWNTKHKCLMACEPREAHYVQNYTETAVYRFGWLNPLPDGAPINAGYMVFEPAIFDYISGDDTVLEREPLEKLAAEGQLMSYMHRGFWQCMDNVREKEMLEKLLAAGKAPWKVWKD